jgi:pyrroline-5-carboxylate reductase
MKIGVMGCGKMGTAWIIGAIRSGVATSAEVTGVDPSPDARHQFAQATGARAFAETPSVADCEVILLCTKPGEVAPALRDLTLTRAGKPILVISIAAGIPLCALEDATPASVRIIRAMPNTPAAIGRGAAGYCLGSRATPQDAEQARLLLEAAGLAVEVPERLMDAVTGLSGSGPAYVYLMIEALADGGVGVGLPRPKALLLAAQTVLGAAAMVLETGEDPAVLRERVCSPGGTTLAGLAELERHGLRAAWIDAVAAATRRAVELGHSAK